MVSSLLSDKRFVGALYIIVCALLGSFLSISISYLYEQGVTTVEFLVLLSFIPLICILIYHLIFCFYGWFNQIDTNLIFFNSDMNGSNNNSIITNTTILSMSDSSSHNNNNNNNYHTFGNNNNGTVQVSLSPLSGHTELYNISMAVPISNYIFCTFPNFKPLDSSSSRLSKMIGISDEWIVMIITGIDHSIGVQLAYIAYGLLSSGNVQLLRITISNFISIIFSIIYFNEILTKWLILGVILAIVGVILIVQPTFIFENNDEINITGLIFACLSGLCRAFFKILLKYSGNVKIQWTAMMIVSFFVKFIIAITELCIVIIYYYYIENDSPIPWNSKIWFVWDSNEYVITLALIGFCLTIVPINILKIKGFQIGDIGKLGLLTTSSIAMTYMLQAWLLDEIQNYITYIGVAIVIICTTIVFWDQTQQSKQRLEIKNIQLNSSVENDYQIISENV